MAFNNRYKKHDTEASDNTFVFVDEEKGVKSLNTFLKARKQGKRFGISNRGAAILINSVLEDLGIR